MTPPGSAPDILTIYGVYMHSYLVAIVSYKYASPIVKLFNIDSRTAPALYSYNIQSYNVHNYYIRVIILQSIYNCIVYFTIIAIMLASYMQLMHAYMHVYCVSLFLRACRLLALGHCKTLI